MTEPRTPDTPATVIRWIEERPRRRAIFNLPPEYGPPEVEALVGPYLDYPGHDYAIVVSEHRHGLRVAHLTFPTVGAAAAVQMALDGIEADGHRLSVGEAKPSRLRELRHDGPAQAHRAARRQAAERELRRGEDRETYRLRALGLTFRAIAASLGRSLGWVQRSLKRWARGGSVPRCSELGHRPCGEAVSGAVRSAHGAGWRRRATGREKHQTTRPESEEKARTRTAPDTARDRRWAAAMSRKVRGMIEGVSDVTE